MREENNLETAISPEGKINFRIDEVLECGFRYANFKLSLRRNRRKKDSRRLTYSYLLRRIREEVNELEQALIDSGLLEREESGKFEGQILEARPSYNIENIALEAADIINFASMICDKTEETE